MIRNSGSRLSLSVSLLLAIFFHMVILLFVKKNSLDFNSLNLNNQARTLKINNIDLIRPEEIARMRRVGIKDGAKTKYFQPDEIKIPKPTALKTPGNARNLSLGNLAPVLPKSSPGPKPTAGQKSSQLERTIQPPHLSMENDTSASHFYFNPKKEKKITRNEEQDNLKQEVYRNMSASNTNAVAQKISNFEIRYERPEGVSEDELNSDEKAYYSFFKRSYANYLQKLYATYEKVSVERPGIEKDFEGKHLLIGKIDYDENGNIVTVKILKSSESDNIHYFFEETLKQLNLPNPPKSFVKNKKTFSTYYQIQIN